MLLEQSSPTSYTWVYFCFMFDRLRTTTILGHTDKKVVNKSKSYTKAHLGRETRTMHRHQIKRSSTKHSWGLPLYGRIRPGAGDTTRSSIQDRTHDDQLCSTGHANYSMPSSTKKFLCDDSGKEVSAIIGCWMAVRSLGATTNQEGRKKHNTPHSSVIPPCWSLQLCSLQEKGPVRTPQIRFILFIPATQ